ncbi:hypothetical protein DICVIV_11798 [Dictyocaulus viviparus]|uniref:Ubiquitin-activating enzyme E1 C-terminal domain-containing protein n=1 Tax=Dictyocaulus viviparus TaxID=29172 RepID=A0A0D8XEW6_DICVI|nr:hypothetical protein DICVIV_11798 [Dictyocaulus viviparus]
MQYHRRSEDVEAADRQEDSYEKLIDDRKLAFHSHNMKLVKWLLFLIMEGVLAVTAHTKVWSWQKLPYVESVKAVVEDVSKRAVPDYQRSLVLEVMATDRNTDEDVEIPYIRYYQL